MPEDLPRSEDEWREALTPSQYRIVRGRGTEPAFSGELLANKEAGTYQCVACGADLFSSETKYDSGSGWPSFWAPVEAARVGEAEDTSYGMVRTEVTCTHCGAHLGHVFPDGPEPAGVRYCINSLSLRFSKDRS